jgi:hypothetical protein
MRHSQEVGNDRIPKITVLTDRKQDKQEKLEFTKRSGDAPEIKSTKRYGISGRFSHVL